MKKIHLLFFLAYCFSAWTQDTIPNLDTSLSKYKRMYSSEDPLFEPKEEPPKEFKKKKDFWGFFLGKKIDGSRTRRGYVTKGQGRTMTIESFRFLKAWEDGSPYVYNKFYFDPYKQKVVKKHKIKEEERMFLKVLHGPYKKVKGEDTLILGYFYQGMKHGRWLNYNKSREKKFGDTSFVFKSLKEKEYWYKGWPKESELNYYESDRDLLKEVIPYMHGEKVGLYYRFFKDKKIAEKGKYVDGYKVGSWFVYYDGKKATSKARHWEFPKDPYYKNSEKERKYLKEAWNKLGEMIYPEDHRGEKAKKQKKGRKTPSRRGR